MIRLKPADFIVKWHKKPCDFCLSDRHSNKLWQFTGIEPEEVKKYAEWMSLGHELGEDPSLFICEVCISWHDSGCGEGDFMPIEAKLPEALLHRMLKELSRRRKGKAGS